MLQFENAYFVDLDKGPIVDQLRKPMHYGNNRANRIGAIVTKEGQAVTLSGDCTGKAILGDDSWVMISNGVINGNEAYIELPSACYSVEGPIRICMNISTESTELTLLDLSGYVKATQTDSAIDPEHPTFSVSELKAVITTGAAEQVEAIEAAGAAQISDINSTGSDQVAYIEAAIEAKGQETLGSIPEDYTAFGNELNSLKDVIKTGVHTFIFSWENGSINTSGANSNNGFTNCIRTPLSFTDFNSKDITIIANDAFTNSYYLRVCKYTIDGTYLSNQSFSGDTFPQILRFDDGYKYRMTWVGPTSATVSENDLSFVWFCEQQYTPAIIEEVIKTGKHTFAFTWENGGINSLGVNNNNGAAYVVRTPSFFTNLNGKDITISTNNGTFANSYYLRIVKYAMDGTYVSNQAIAGDTFPQTVHFDDGYKYRMAWQAPSSATVSENDLSFVWFCEQQYTPAVIGAQIDSLDERVDALKTGDTPISVTFEEGRWGVYLNRVNAYTGVDKIRAVVPVIPNCLYEITLCSYGTSSQPIIFADQYRYVLSSVFGESTRTNKVLRLIAPANAAYLYVTSDTYSASAVTPAIKKIVNCAYAEAQASGGNKLANYMGSGIKKTDLMEASFAYQSWQINTSGAISAVSSNATTLEIYPVFSGMEYILFGEKVRLNVNAPIAAYGTELFNGTDSVNTEKVLISGSSNIETDYNEVFIAPGNGYLYVEKDSRYRSLSVYHAEYQTDVINGIYESIKDGKTTLNITWEYGKILSNGTMQNSTTAIRTKDYLNIGGQTILVSCAENMASTLGFNIYKYEEDNTFVNLTYTNEQYLPKQFTLAPGYKYKFSWQDNNTQTYPTDITVKQLTEIEYMPSLIQTEINRNAYDLTMADALVRAEKRNPFALSAFEKGFVTFVWDDLRSDLDLVASIFAEYEFPIGVGAIPSKLNNTADGLSEPSHGYTVGMKMSEVCNQIVADGGEIMAHNSAVITATTQYDYDFMYNHFMTTRKELENAGYTVRGLIRAGGTGAVTGTPEIEKWLIGNYEYSNNGTAVNFSQERTNIVNTLDNLKAAVLSAYTNHTWVKFMCHSLDSTGAAGISEEDLRALLDYITGLGLDVVTYAYIFDHYSSSQLLEAIKYDGTGLAITLPGQ